MKNFLNKEIIIKRSVKQLIINTLISAITNTIIIYFLLAQAGDILGEFFITVYKSNIELEVVLILFPFIFLIKGIINYFIYMFNNKEFKRIYRERWNRR